MQPPDVMPPMFTMSQCTPAFPHLAWTHTSAIHFVHTSNVNVFCVLSFVARGQCCHLIHHACKSHSTVIICVLQAILLAQHNRNNDAVKLLEPLFEAIEPMQESIAVRVCLLLVELYLSSHSFGPAASELPID